MLDQHFQMFDRPPRESPWFVYEAQLNNGKMVDLFSGEALSYEKPESIRLKLKYHHLRKLHRNLVHPEHNPNDVTELQVLFREALADYYVDRWNESHSKEEQVKHFRLLCYRHMIGPGFNGIDQTHRVWVDRSKAGSIFDREFKQFENGEFF